MRSLLRRLFFPPFVVLVLTLAPFLIPLAGFLNRRTRGLSRSVGVDPELFVYALVCVMAFWLGTAVFIRQKSKPGPEPEPEPGRLSARAVKRARRAALLAAIALLIVGFGILFSTPSGSYMESLMRSVRLQEADPGLRESAEGFIASERVPGVLRMFAYSIVGCLIFMLAIALANPPWARGWRAFRLLLLFSGLGILARSLIVLDRLPVLTALGLGVFVAAHRMRPTKARLLASGLGLLALLLVTFRFFNFSYSVRVNPSDRYNQILENADLGIANASLAYRTTTHFGWGTSSLMGPILVVPRGLGIKYEFPAADSEWIWNPASNLLCVSIREYWIFGFVIYLVYGAVCGRILRGRNDHPHSVLWGLAHLWSLYVLFSIWTQPIVASSDVWAAIILTLFVGRAVDKRSEASERMALAGVEAGRGR